MRTFRAALCAIFFSALLAHAQAPGPLTFRRAIELATRNGNAVAIAKADETRAAAGYREARGLFLPQMNIGAGLAYSNGFPLSLENAAPSLFQLTSQQFLLNLAQRDFMKSAKAEWAAVSRMAQERRDQTILETALTYAQLDRLTSTLKVLSDQSSAALKAEKVAKERVQAGVDAEVELTRARLGTARLHLSTTQAQGKAALLKQRLAQLTGLPEAEIETIPESMPPLPDVSTSPDLLTRAMQNSAAIAVADQQANAKSFRAKGEHKQLYPAIDLAGQYAVLARHNNYDDFFSRFQRHNLTVGLVIRFPFWNFAQRANAEAADAEAVKSRKEADEVKHKVVNEAAELRATIRQLAAARDIARLEYQISSVDAQAAQVRVEAGSATLRDLETARVVEGQRYASFLDANLELEKAHLQLLKITGEIEKWALSR